MVQRQAKAHTEHSRVGRTETPGPHWDVGWWLRKREPVPSSLGPAKDGDLCSFTCEQTSSEVRQLVYTPQLEMARLRSEFEFA